MITDLTIEGFRGFERLEMRGLGRVNLLVGTNNSGKTSVLEAIQLYALAGDIGAVRQVALRRGERLYENADLQRGYPPEVDVCHLFHGHRIDVGSQFRVLAQTDAGTSNFTARVVEHSRRLPMFEGQLQLPLFEEQLNGGVELEAPAEEPNLAVELRWSQLPGDGVRLPLSNRGGLASDTIRRFPRPRLEAAVRVRLISTAGLTVDDVVGMFDGVVLTREEQLVTEALRTIEPRIERLATVSSDRQRNLPAYPGERGGIVVRCKGSDQRIPIGSMGDGMWRMLGLALSLAAAENGILLIDEIDTGLHFTVMDDMWRLVHEASRRLNVQTFATTHSRDAYESLAAISRSSVSEGSEVTIQRIDPARLRAVAFTEQEIVASAERGMEVR